MAPRHNQFLLPSRPSLPNKRRISKPNFFPADLSLSLKYTSFRPYSSSLPIFIPDFLPYFSYPVLTHWQTHGRAAYDPVQRVKEWPSFSVDDLPPTMTPMRTVSSIPALPFPNSYLFPISYPISTLKRSFRVIINRKIDELPVLNIVNIRPNNCISA